MQGGGCPPVVATVECDMEIKAGGCHSNTGGMMVLLELKHYSIGNCFPCVVLCR